MIVKVMLDTFYILIRLMAFSCHKDNISGLSQHNCSTNGFASVNNTKCLGTLNFIKTGKHIVDNILGFFKARIVASDNDAVATIGGLLRHQGALALVAITTSSTHRNNLSFRLDHFPDSRKHIL